ncbi:MAG: RDD family protein [Kofleriaceae bacterium]
MKPFGGEDNTFVRSIVTPEGIPLRFVLARAGDRAGAFLIDVALQIAVTLFVVIGLRVAVGTGEGWLTAFIVLLTFLFTTFYFPFFEVRWQGATIGKRAIGIRVIDARGGQLETSAVLARNLVRELEVWAPLRFLLARDMLWPTAPAWATWLAVGWTFVFMFMPLFNRDRLRIGDMIAGTRVVVRPKLVLVPDLVQQAAEASTFAFAGAPAATTHSFTEAQLSIYGVYELQVLEGVLRMNPSDMSFYDVTRTVSEKVRTKIKYEGPVTDDTRFLREFYAAQRAHLEQKMLFGQRREDKHASKT